MDKRLFEIESNRQLAAQIFEMRLRGDASAIKRAGQFVNIAIDGLYLRRPISVCDFTPNSLTIIYKVVGEGTYRLSRMQPCTQLDILTGLGNGFDAGRTSANALLIGGGVGIPPLFHLAKELIADNKDVSVILGFNCKKEIFYVDRFTDIGATVTLSTVDGSVGIKGFVTDAMNEIEHKFDYFYACGPIPMLRAVCDSTTIDGELSFEERMGCGFGACMGCSCKTRNGNKRICKEGPVLRRNDIIW